MNNEEIKCVNCGVVVGENEYQVIDNKYVCNSCIENCYYRCSCCDRYVHNDNIECINSGLYDEGIICRDCARNSDEVYICDDCGNYYDRDNVRIDSYDTCICDCCYDNHSYITCEDCGYITRDYYYSDRDDAYYCRDCEEKHRDRVGDWHEHKGDFVPYYASGETRDNDTILFGREYETELDYGACNMNYRDAENELLDTFEENVPCYFERDGSLNDSGVEIITQPMSWAYIQEHKEDFKRALNKAIELGYRSDNEDCGQHIHVSRPSDEVIDRIELILETYKEQFIAFARRHNTHYSAFLSDRINCYYDTDNVDPNRILSLDYIKKVKGRNDRYMVLNLTNYDTIEFRLFRGTLRYETCMANLELVHNIVTLCGDLNIPVEEITWDKLTTGEFVTDFVNERGIHTDIVPKDMTLAFIERDNRNKEIIESIMKSLKKIALKTYHNQLETLGVIKEFDENNLQSNKDKIRDLYMILDNLYDIIRYAKDDLSCNNFEAIKNRLLCYIERNRLDTSKTNLTRLMNKLNSIEL